MGRYNYPERKRLNREGLGSVRAALPEVSGNSQGNERPKH